MEDSFMISYSNIRDLHNFLVKKIILFSFTYLLSLQKSYIPIQFWFLFKLKLTIFDVHKFPVEVMNANVSIIIFHQDLIYFSVSDSYFGCVIVYFLRNRKHLISHSVLDSHSIILFILSFSYSPQTQVCLISVTIL